MLFNFCDLNCLRLTVDVLFLPLSQCGPVKPYTHTQRFGPTQRPPLRQVFSHTAGTKPPAFKSCTALGSASASHMHLNITNHKSDACENQRTTDHNHPSDYIELIKCPNIGHTLHDLMMKVCQASVLHVPRKKHLDHRNLKI